MKTKAELEKYIVTITMKIHSEYPELSKYIEEMPENVSENDKNAINIENMEEYYNSLVELLAEYSKTHKPIKVPNSQEMLNFPGYPHYPPSEDIYNKGGERNEVEAKRFLKK